LSLNKIVTFSILTGLFALAQGSPAQDKPAPARKPAATAAAASPVDNVIKLLKIKMSEALIIKTLQSQKPYTPSPEEMVKLKDAGASDNLIGVIMDPTSASAPAAAPVAAAVTPPPAAPLVSVTEAKGADCPAPAAVSAAPNASKRRVAISAFDYAAVKTAVTSIAGNDVNIGQGIRSMLIVKMAQSKTVVLLEREKIGAVMKEQDFGATNRVKQGTNAKIGQITGADAQLFGDIVTFGRDDTKKKNGAGAGLRYIPGIGGIAAGAANAKTSDKAVVVINLRLVDAETGEVIDSEEARGESTRTSTNWGAVAGTWRGGAGGNSDMTSSNFGETIIGEATQDAVNKIAAILEQKMTGGTRREYRRLHSLHQRGRQRRRSRGRPLRNPPDSKGSDRSGYEGSSR
jgi:curli biogenesis system outer membrane secretion channel CsgG